MPLSELIQLRKSLHRQPEIAFEEWNTAARISEFFHPLSPDHIISQLGGTGLAFVFKGKKPGPRTLFRCELDALRILEKSEVKYKSQMEGKGHLCGHDGHMAIICGLGEKLAANRPESGEVVLLFQPAEETGQGARAILDDPKFELIRPDYAFALHNLPGFPLHQVVLRNGTFAAGSTGFTIKLTGKTAHAAHPEDGINPASAIAHLIQVLPKIPEKLKNFALVTIIHAELASLAFGTSAGRGGLSLTVRAFDQSDLENLINRIKAEAKGIAILEKLTCEFELLETFAVSKNDPKAGQLVEKVLEDLDLSWIEKSDPFRWSEDFGLFSQACPAFLFGLGAGEDCPQLHEGTYDFPDELIETGVRIFEGIARKVDG
ncbi:MAG: amidohydrolase [Algoriphagus sp.]|uniref:amidohydrolase n=1 Tax=Algoriphagus sp. TaxID=1872435 RepID=UPI00261E9859|nr:amidohydrolase [Algoriphagus sp.]MDG1275998.1 amidohydrolase [Algoriphagus sp.]